MENSLKQATVLDTSRVICYHGYDIPRYSMNRLDSLQYYMANHINPLDDRRDNIKKYDIVFGYTAITKDREEQFDKITKCINTIAPRLTMGVKTFVKHKSLGLDTFIDRDAYLDYISKSRFTFIIPPYDTTQFSAYRFFESVNNNCLPFIGNDVKVDEFIQSFDLDESIIDEITFRYTHLPPLAEDRRIELIEYFKNKLLTYTKGLQIV
jgi:hypothetical protein